MSSLPWLFCTHLVYAFVFLLPLGTCFVHYNDVIMGAIASQITSLATVYSIVYSDADQRKHQSSASLAFVRGIHRGPVSSPHKWPVTRKMFAFDDVIMFHTCLHNWFSVVASLLLSLSYRNTVSLSLFLGILLFSAANKGCLQHVSLWPGSLRPSTATDGAWIPRLITLSSLSCPTLSSYTWGGQVEGVPWVGVCVCVCVWGGGGGFWWKMDWGGLNFGRACRRKKWKKIGGGGGGGERLNPQPNPPPTPPNSQQHIFACTHANTMHW